jgi:hypothetical protein
MTTKKPVLAPDEVQELVLEIFGDSLHAKRCESLGNAVVGLTRAEALSIHEIGRGMARARGVAPKHAIKQVDRLLGNDGLVLDDAFKSWARWLIGARPEIVVAIDWTEYAADGHHRIALYLITEHGRATPLVWKTVRGEDLRTRRSEYEADVLRTLREIVPEYVRVTVLGDRAFGDASLYELCDEVLHFDYVFRFRGCILVQDADGHTTKAHDLVPGDGSAHRIERPRVTHQRYRVRGVVCVHDAEMKEPWCLVTSRSDSADFIVQMYGRRFTIEESFRDEKDPHFGFGVLHTTIGEPLRRDRLLLVLAVASALLTLIGRAGETTGAYRALRANTSDRRQHSLLRQGREYVRGLEEHRYTDLRAELCRLLDDRRAAIFGVI